MIEIEIKFDARYKNRIGGLCKNRRAFVFLGRYIRKGSNYNYTIKNPRAREFWHRHIKWTIIPDILSTIHHEVLHAVLRKIGVIKLLFGQYANTPIKELPPRELLKLINFSHFEEQLSYKIEEWLRE